MFLLSHFKLKVLMGVMMRNVFIRSLGNLLAYYIYRTIEKWGAIIFATAVALIFSK